MRFGEKIELAMQTAKHATQMMFNQKKGAFGTSNLKSIPEAFISAVITIAVVIGLYPTLKTYVMTLNTTFDNSFTNALAGGAGLVALVISIGLGALILMGMWKLFAGKGGK